LISLDHLWLLVIALVLDALFGDPERIWQRLPHPVAIVGGLIGLLDRTLNVDALTAAWRKVAGIFTLVIVVALAMLAGYGLELGFRSLPFGWIGTAVAASLLIAGRSLYDHVLAVADAFAEGLPAARAAVSRIVGRDPGSLDQPRVCRAAIESTAENFSDGVIAPAVWLLLLGLPGLFAYKAINTADSMIGHLTPRYEAFGWASARLDDLVNLPASRIAGFLVALAAPAAGGSIAQAVRVMFADAPHHRSPNAGWPEAAMASALGIALAGPRRYAGIIVSDPFVNASGRRDANPTDIRRALRVYLVAHAVFLAIAAPGAVAVLWR
jgi:adenosylcobinamide-phosphate synthase